MKNKFIKNTFILTIGGLFTKVLGMLVKIVLTRNLGEAGLGIYSLISPTFLLLINISMLGLPSALNVLISTKKYNNKNLIITSSFITIFIDIIIFIILLLFSDFISINLLNEKRCSLGLFSIGFVLPFISISNILRSYYFSKEKIKLHVITNILEDIIKLLLIIFLLPKISVYGIKYMIAFVILTNILCELSSILIFIYFLPKFKINKKDLKPDLSNIKSIFKISLPTTFSRLIGTIGYFFEPIILTYTLIKVGYDNSYIVNEYGIINGYVMQIVLLPSFFTNAISQALIPSISNAYSNKRYLYVKKKFKQAIIIATVISLPFTIIFMFNPELVLKILFKTTKGAIYIKILAPICMLHYIQSITSSVLQSINKANVLIESTIIGTILRCLALYIFSSIKIGLYGLIIATSINIIFVTCHNLYKLNKFLRHC